MENNKVNTKKIMLNYGVVLGVIAILIELVYYSFNMTNDKSWHKSALPALAMIVTLVLAYKEFKSQNQSFMTVGEGIKLGIGLVMISAVVGAVYSYVFMNFIEPSFMADAIELQRELMISTNQSDEAIEMAVKSMEIMSNPFLMAGLQLVMSLFFGFIFSLIISVIMKKNRVLEL